MLQSIRERASGWIAWVVFILISIPFALWGVHEYFGTDPNPVVAKVEGVEIGQRRFQQAYQDQRRRLRETLGERFNEADIDAIALRDRTLDQLIADEALLQAALDGGMRISDEQVAATIRAEQTFRRDGAFAQSAYDAWLRSQALSPAGFEFRLRRTLLADQLAAGVARTGIVPPRGADRLARLLQQRRSFDVLTLRRERYSDIELDESELRAWYEQNKSEFITPERVVARYVLLSRGALAATVDVSDEELRQRYENTKGDLFTPEQRKVSHILLQVPPDADEEEVAETRARIEALAGRIASGESFADVAAEASEDPGSAAQGGDLGFFARGIMDPAFEEAAFSREVGVVGEPVRSDFGFHLVKVTEVKEGGAKPFEEVRTQLRAAVQQERAEQHFFEQVERLANLSFEHPDSLEPAADTLGLEVQTSEPFPRDGLADDELFSERRVARAAWSEDVLQNGNNSEPIDLGDGRVVVLRVADRLPSAPQTFEEARADIERELRAQKVDEALRAAAAELLDQLRQGAERDAVAALVDVQWRSHERVGRDADSVDPAVSQAVFRMPRPAGDAAAHDAVPTLVGDFAVIALRTVEAGDTDDGQAAQIRQAVALGRGRQAFAAYVNYVREHADVEIFQETLANAL